MPADRHLYSPGNRQDIPSGKIIKKTALSKYVLHTSNLDSLKFEKIQNYTTKRTAAGYDYSCAAHAYREDEVKAVALLVHGSEEALALAQKSGMKLPWEERDALARAAAQKPPKWEETPQLRDLKTQFPPWVWEACNDALDRSHPGSRLAMYPGSSQAFSAKERVLALRDALDVFQRYPTRPRIEFPSSPRVDALRALLDDAPMLAEAAADQEGDKEGDSVESRTVKFMTRENLVVEVVTEWFWPSSFIDRLYLALAEVIFDHEEEGWQSVRWEVYDKYRECVSGIYYHDGAWNDNALDWLRGQLGNRRFEELHHPRRKSEHCLAYNKLLPVKWRTQA
ncbi:hypothetical protein HGRIS_013396 [Hohenbuehelia grisea]|uniref:Uncharacterized protein n=1 Tax=Hohenbuehelia grisea TaxID=104357 RepID=A0ABR3IVE1_9AGAR